jgi:beta-glucanase (GH16 family)
MRIAAFLLGAALVSTVGLSDGSPTRDETPPAGATQAGDPAWKLVWSDEFDGTGLPDPKKWSYEVGRIRNREAQTYTKERRENARVEDGSLVIEARKEKLDGAEYTSASLHTKGKSEWRRGRIEVRAKLPTGRGMWPAIWMLGVNIKEVGWPRCGEIDIMENVGFDPDTIHANIHTQAYNHVKRTGKGAKITVAKPHEDFHVYAVEWRSSTGSPQLDDRLDFFVDGKRYFTYANDKQGEASWPFDRPHYLILNAAVGGTWGGQKGIDDAIFPQRYFIDYVRVYEHR